MEMCEPARLTVASDRPFQLIDVTDGATAYVAASGLADGIAHASCPHTSCGLLITELEDGLHEDLERLLDTLAPTTAPWAHDDLDRRHQNIEPDERKNGWSHMRAALATQPSLTVPILDGGLALGRWQRLFLLELDGPRPARTVVLQAWGRAHPGSAQGGGHG
jgi:secondary thiamine-phosphate synthase enzyme